MSKKEDFFIKIVLVGDANVGKTNLIKRYALNEFDERALSTIGMDSQFVTGRYVGKTAKVAIWDTAGMECYSANTQLHYRGAAGVMVVYDITDSRTFDHVEKWLKDIRKSCDDDDVIVMLVANKRDLKHVRCVETDEGKRFADENQLLFYETSACDATNVRKAFETVIEHAVQVKKLQEMNDKITGNVRLKKTGPKKKRGCCKV